MPKYLRAGKCCRSRPKRLRRQQQRKKWRPTCRCNNVSGSSDAIMRASRVKRVVDIQHRLSAELSVSGESLADASMATELHFHNSTHALNTFAECLQSFSPNFRIYSWNCQAG